MVSHTFSSTLQGIDGAVIEVEASCQRSLPKILITGLPGEIVKESRERVRACLVNLGFEVPTTQILVHLLPANARKQGSQLDLAIAVSLLVAERGLPADRIRRLAFLGELGLDGTLLPVVGAVPLIEALEKDARVETIVIPSGNAWEAAMVRSRKARLAAHFGEVLDALNERGPLAEVGPAEAPEPPVTEDRSIDCVVGQGLAKRALQLAVAGRHHLLLVGPPGVGKSLLASCAPGLLPPLDDGEKVEVLKSYTHHLGERRDPARRPFRAPHHSVSAAALLGGGSGVVLPGEVTLAHRGVLFLDEFPEFRKDVIEGLREPLQNGDIQLGRVGSTATLPARFTLVAAMNPCPCGLAFSASQRCMCARELIVRYQRRISGAILDRMDLGVVLGAPRQGAGAGEGPRAGDLKEGIARALAAQAARYGSPIARNGDVAVVGPASAGLDLAGEARDWADALIEGGEVSFRAIHKTIKVARTIADIDGSPAIETRHLWEAWTLRCSASWSRPGA